ncbi:MAG: cysteine desulfurase [Candidatus Kaiserbacteria bacterium]|nr:MAG: cysteine desulfurase [Candidatus Kaiserbacteria bacterium]
MRWFKKRIYLDYASAPPVSEAAIRAMRAAEMLEGNPGGLHAEAVAAKASLEASRERIALLIGCKSREVVFTSGLSEGNALAIVGFARAFERTRRGLEGTHWISTIIEHSSVLESFSEIERMGGRVTHLAPDDRGIVAPARVAAALRPETVFVSVGWANGEIGVVQPLADIARAIRDFDHDRTSKIVFHSDAGQAPLYLPTLVSSLGVDLLTLGSNKLRGPHGIGALVNRSRVDLSPAIFGGSQERGMRPGTEGVALAAGFAAAFEDMVRVREEESRRLLKIRSDLAKGILESLPGTLVNGDLAAGLPHILNLSIPEVSSEYFALALDRQGIAVSTKSACKEGQDRSHVVEALGGPTWRASNTLRISLGAGVSASDLPRIISAFSAVAAISKK